VHRFVTSFSKVAGGRGKGKVEVVGRTRRLFYLSPDFTGLYARREGK
jgi:hypothetical protein